MSIVGLGKRIRIYLGESDQWGSRPLSVALLERLRAEGCAGATVVRGVAGFGAHSRIHTASIVRLSEDLPILVEWVDTPERVARVLPGILAMVGEGMVTSEDVEVLFYQHRVVGDIPARLQVREVMTRNAASIRPETPLREAVALLLGKDYRALPVVDARERVVGIVSNGDLVDRGGLRLRIELLGALGTDQLAATLAAIEQGKTVADVMTTPAVTIGPDATLAEAAHLMVTRALKRLPVVGADGELLGVLSRADLLRTRSDAYPRPIPETAPRPARTIGDVMRTDVPVVGRNASVGEVLDAVVSTRLNRALVVDEQQRVVGVVTDAILLRRLSPADHPGVARLLMSRLPFVHLDPAERLRLEHAVGKTAAQLMDPNLPTVRAATPLGEAIESMLRDRRKILPVVDDTGRLLGAVDRADLLRTLVT